MADQCVIGPVSITDAHLFDNNTFSYSNSATQTVASGSTITTRGQFTEEHAFDIICTNEEFLQLRGVVEMGEVIFMDTSNTLALNSYLQHKGWVILTNLEAEMLSPTMVQCSIQYIRISGYEKEFITMDYSTGVYDGVNIVPGYNITDMTYQLQEDGSNATTNWSTIRKYPAACGGTFSSDGTKLNLSCSNTVDKKPEGNCWVICDTKSFSPSFTLETVLNRGSLPASGSNPASLGVMFTTTDYASGDAEFQKKTAGDVLEFQWNLTSSSTSGGLAYIAKGGSVQWKISTANLNLGTSASLCGLRMEFTADGRVRVSTDLGVTGTWTEQYYGPSGLINRKNLKLYLLSKNTDTTIHTSAFEYVYIYNNSAVTFPNLVMLPAEAVTANMSTSSRAIEGGMSSYFVNPTEEIRYITTHSDFYKGSVQLWSSNNPDNESRQVFSTDTELTTETTMIKNGMTRAYFNGSTIYIDAWGDGQWNNVTLMGTAKPIDYIKPIYISSERIVVQLNSSKITMLRSSPIITIDNPIGDISYTLRDTYVRGSGVITTPSAGQALPMMADTDYWCSIYDSSADTYRMLLVLPNPATIFCDNIPASAPLYGVGWSHKSATNYETAQSLAQQWYKQTRTGMSLKQII